MYSAELLMMGRGTARKMQRFLTKVILKKLVRLLVLLKRNKVTCIYEWNSFGHWMFHNT